MSQLQGEVWLKKGQAPAKIKGNMPQLLKHIVFFLEGGTQTAREILDDIDRDAKLVKDKWQQQ